MHIKFTLYNYILMRRVRQNNIIASKEVCENLISCRFSH